MHQRVVPSPAGRLCVRAGFALAFALLVSAARAADGAGAAPAGGAAPGFVFQNVMDAAKALAAAPFSPPPDEVPERLRSLTRTEWRGVGYDLPENEVWRRESGPLAVDPLLPGFVLNQTTVINIMDEGGVRTLPFSAAALQGGDRDLVETFSRLAPGFAGFTLNPPNSPRLASGVVWSRGLMCASHFQFSAKNSRLGAFARPLLLDIATDAGESYSMLREYWLRKPAAGDSSLTVYALMDSPMMAGAYEFVITPGTSTILDVRAVFHPRRGVPPPSKIGLSSLTGMFLFSETEKSAADYRPEVHNADGLLFTRGGNDWQWVPLRNPGRLTVSRFPLGSPRGYGLIQRDADFDHYQDLDNRFDQSSSVWIEPRGDWGPGELELMEIPGSKDFHANIMAYWVPERIHAATPAGGAEETAADADADAPAPLAFAYRMYWTPPGTGLHGLAAVQATRLERPGADGAITFRVDFEGGELNALPADTGLTSEVSLPNGVVLLEKQLIKNAVTGGWRLTLTVVPPQSGVLGDLLTARDGPPQLWLSAFLKRGENLPEPLTETWRYRVVP